MVIITEGWRSSAKLGGFQPIPSSARAVLLLTASASDRNTGTGWGLKYESRLGTRNGLKLQQKTDL